MGYATLGGEGLRGDRVVRFGPFELCLDTGELRKLGIRVRLQGKPFHILSALLEEPGHVVTREELRSRLWPADTFVDFESGLNTAVNRLRVALGDSAENPIYIETLARLGYRFIAPSQFLMGGTSLMRRTS
jgi:DNA-binding winged helix-turn-helix (wHTH) protein